MGPHGRARDPVPLNLGLDYNARGSNGVRTYAVRLHRNYRSELLPRDTFVAENRRMARRDAVVVRIARDKTYARDIIDLALIADRRGERSRPFREYLSGKNAR